MKASLLLVTFLTGVAVADGLPLTDGRYTLAPASVFTLTRQQKSQIALYRRCYTDNTKTPYVFRLTGKQSAALMKEAGLSPSRFEIYETYRGVNDAGPHWNLVLRYSEDQIEVPHDLLLANVEAERAEDTQGWAVQPPLPVKAEGLECSAVQQAAQRDVPASGRSAR